VPAGYSVLNRGLFADRGQRHSLGLTYALPGSKARNWVASYDYTGYVPLFGRWTLQLGASLAYGDKLGDTTGLSPYKRFYAGGPDTVRGFVESSLGPRDSFGNPYGGNMKAVARAEIILPLPQKWQTAGWRVSTSICFRLTIRYLGRDLQTRLNLFKYDDLKQSAGVGVQWLAPSLGIFRFGYGVPLNADDGDSVRLRTVREFPVYSRPVV
jgi:outer membrane protein insertion porin family